MRGIVDYVGYGGRGMLHYVVHAKARNAALCGACKGEECFIMWCMQRRGMLHYVQVNYLRGARRCCRCCLLACTCQLLLDFLHHAAVFFGCCFDLLFGLAREMGKSQRSYSMVQGLGVRGQGLGVPGLGVRLGFWLRGWTYSARATLILNEQETLRETYMIQLYMIT